MLRFSRDSVSHLDLDCIYCRSRDLVFFPSRFAGTWVVCGNCGRGEQIYRLVALHQEVTPLQAISALVGDPELQIEELHRFEAFDIRLRKARAEVSAALDRWLSLASPVVISRVLAPAGANVRDERLRRRIGHLVGSVESSRSGVLFLPCYLMPDFPVGAVLTGISYPHWIENSFTGFFDPITSGIAGDLSSLRGELIIFDDPVAYLEAVVSFARGGFGTESLLHVPGFSSSSSLGPEAVEFLRSYPNRKILVARSMGEDAALKLAVLIGADHMRLASTSVSSLVAQLTPPGFTNMVRSRAVPPSFSASKPGTVVRPKRKMLPFGRTTVLEKAGMMVEVGQLALRVEVIEERPEGTVYYGTVHTAEGRDGIFSVSRRELETRRDWIDRLRERFDVPVRDQFFSGRQIVEMFESSRAPRLVERRFGWHGDARAFLAPGVLFSGGRLRSFRSWRLFVPLSSTAIEEEIPLCTPEEAREVMLSLGDAERHLVGAAVSACLAQAVFVSPFRVVIRSDRAEDVSAALAAMSIPLGRKVPGWPVQVASNRAVLIKSDEVGKPAELVEVEIDRFDTSVNYRVAFSACLEQVLHSVLLGRRSRFSFWVTVMDELGGVAAGT